MDLFAGLRLLLFNMSFVSLFGPLVFVGSLIAGLLRPSRLVAFGEGALQVLSVLRFFVVLVDFAVEECFLLSSALLSLLGTCLWYDLDFDDFLMDSAFGPFCCIFELRSARQVERFAVCSSGICRQ